MGAWGTGPLDNDTAADWFFRLTEVPVTDMIIEGLNSKDYDEVRAAAWLLSQVGYNFVYPIDSLEEHKKLAADRLSKMVADDDWIQRWQRPKEIHASVMAQIYKLSEKK